MWLNNSRALRPLRAFCSKFKAKRLDAVEIAADFRFVHRQHDALAQHVGQNLQAFDGAFLKNDRIDVHALAAFGVDANIDLFGFHLRIRLDDQGADLIQKSRLLACRNVEQHHCPVAEQDGNASAANRHRQAAREPGVRLRSWPANPAVRQAKAPGL